MVNELGRTQKAPKNVLMIHHRLFASLFTLTPLYLFTHPVLQLIGYGSILSIFLLCVYDFIGRLRSIRVTQWWNWFFVWSAYSLITYVRKPSMGALYALLLQMVLLLFPCMLSSVNWTTRIITSVSLACKVLCGLLFVPMLAVASVGTGVGYAMFNNVFSPVLYKLLLPCSYFFLVDSKHKLWLTLFFAFLFIRTGERTSAGVILMVFAFYVFLGMFQRAKFVKRQLFSMVFLMTICSVFVYIALQYHPVGAYLNRVFREFTGGNFFSGRQRLWGIAVTHAKESPLFGVGLNNRVLASYGIGLSLHNTYLHLILQGGLVELLLFYGFLRSIWREYLRNFQNDRVRLAASFLLGMLVFINFEVTMIGNTVTTALYFWLVLAVGLGVGGLTSS